MSDVGHPPARYIDWSGAFRDLRVAHKVSLRQLAEAMNESIVLVGEVERGLITHPRVRRAMVVALAECLEA